MMVAGRGEFLSSFDRYDGTGATGSPCPGDPTGGIMETIMETDA
jgi:hypothetical protein